MYIPCLESEFCVYVYWCSLFARAKGLPWTSVSSWHADSLTQHPAGTIQNVSSPETYLWRHQGRRSPPKARLIHGQSDILDSRTPSGRALGANQDARRQLTALLLRPLVSNPWK